MLCCCGVEIAALVIGLLTIDRGVFQLGQWRMVRGTPACVIGGILSSQLPALLIGGGLLNLIEALTGNPPGSVLQGVILLPAAATVLIGLPAVIVIVIAAGENPARRKTAAAASESQPDTPIPPMDPNNPYASPQSTGPDTGPDETEQPT